jgi:hypothetical protein
MEAGAGRISGTPTQAGLYSVRFGASDAHGDTVYGFFLWTVNRGLRTVPNMIGATRLQAADILFTAGLSLGNEHEVVESCLWCCRAITRRARV